MPYKSEIEGPDPRELLRLMEENLPVGFFMVNPEGTILAFGRAAEEITGWRREEAVGKSCREILASSLCEKSCPLLGREGEPPESEAGKKTVLHHRDGRAIPVSYTSAPLFDEKGRLLGGIGLFQDLRARESLEKGRELLISMFAHDLKAPVATAGGLVARLLRGKGGPLTEKQKEYLKAIEQEIRRLDEYIHSILDILRIESGRVPLSLEPCHLERALTDMAKAYEVQAEKKGLRILVEVPEELGLVEVDKGQLHRAVGNLLDNAIKFSPQGGTVTVRAYREDEGAVRFEIEDEGPGIPPQDLPRIFDPFYKGKSGKAGSGLGLAIAKSIIEAHGGRIWAETSPRSGTRMIFTIPQRGRER